MATTTHLLQETLEAANANMGRERDRRRKRVLASLAVVLIGAISAFEEETQHESPRQLVPHKSVLLEATHKALLEARWPTNCCWVKKATSFWC